MTLLLLAGMQAIPDDVYEAARVDGATAWQLLRKITFPILLPISVTAILIRGLEIFKIIDVIVVTTGGGPGSATESLTMYIFDTALTFGNYRVCRRNFLCAAGAGDPVRDILPVS